jgi:hypothetical protein
MFILFASWGGVPCRHVSSDPWLAPMSPHVLGPVVDFFISTPYGVGSRFTICHQLVIDFLLSSPLLSGLLCRHVSSDSRGWLLHCHVSLTRGQLPYLPLGAGCPPLPPCASGPTPGSCTTTCPQTRGQLSYLRGVFDDHFLKIVNHILNGIILKS